MPSRCITNQIWLSTYRDGRLQEGDQILAIDGQLLDANISHKQAIHILQQAKGLVEIVVARGQAQSSGNHQRAASTVSTDMVSIPHICYADYFSGVGRR